MLLNFLFLAAGFLNSASALSGADVVLSCSYVEEGSGLGSMGGARALFTRTPATMVLRDLQLKSQLSAETVTPYNSPESPNPEDIIFEVIVTSPQIPEADLLLHADCNEQEVTCELSRYLRRGDKEGEESAYFIGSVQLEGGGISFSLILQTLPVEEASHLMQRKLELPLSQSGTLLTEVAFVIFSRMPTVMAPIGGETLLDCGFEQKDPLQMQELGLEWRLQHRGHGRRVLELKSMQTDEEPVVKVERDGCSVDPALVTGERNVSLRLSELRVPDEGTYICTVSVGLLQAQQVVQLQVVQQPHVSLSADKVIFVGESPQRLICHCEHYYPLDVQVEWFSHSPTASEPVSLNKYIALSSHRQYTDGTLSISSYLTLHPSDHPPGTNITCQVSHISLATPLTITVPVVAAQPGSSYLTIVGVLIATGLFLYWIRKLIYM